MDFLYIGSGNKLIIIMRFPSFKTILNVCHSLLILMLSCTSSFGEITPSLGIFSNQLYNSTSMGFVENGGQILDENGHTNADVLYYYSCDYFSIHFKRDGYSYELKNLEDSENQEGINLAAVSQDFNKLALLNRKIRVNRIDVHFDRCIPGTKPVSKDTLCEYLFYNGNHTGSDYLHAFSFKEIVYRNIYKGVDVVFKILADGTLKYDIELLSAEYLSQIQLTYTGQNTISLQGDLLKLTTENGWVEESIPLSFYNNNLEPLKVLRVCKNNTLEFVVKENCFKDRAITIDPKIEWGTYYGGFNTENTFAICTDGYENIYVGGSTSSTVNIATTGSHQTTIGGGIDAFVLKLNRDGMVLWCTYYGGSGNEWVLNIKVDPNNDVYICGLTSSTSAIASTNAFQKTHGGQEDAFLVKFSPKGKRSWGTYFGGTNSDIAYGLFTGESGEILIAGTTNSTTGIATTGAFQSSIGGNSDAFVAQFSNLGTINWSTYYGGSEDDRIWSLYSDELGNVYASGRTKSNSGIASSGSFRNTLSGAYDGLIVKFSSYGKRIWATYFGGSSDENFLNSEICLDKKGGLFVSGATGSDTGIATYSCYQTKIGGSKDLYVSKFTTSGSRVWSTYIGGSGFEELGGISSDHKGRIYFAGQTRSSSNLATKNSFQDSFYGATDGFFGRLNDTGGGAWISYYGGEKDDECSDIICDTKGNLYLLGSTTSLNRISTKNSFKDTLSGSGKDAFVIKFRGDIYNYDAGIDRLVDPLAIRCAGMRTIKVLLKNFGRQQLDSVLLGFSLDGKIQPMIHWKGQLKADSMIEIECGPYHFTRGSQNLKIWASYPNGQSDSSSINDTLIQSIWFTGPNAITGSDTTVCPSDSVNLGGAPFSGNTYEWASFPTGFYANTARIRVKAEMNVVYYLKETATLTGCTRNDSVRVDVFNKVNYELSKSNSICHGDSIELRIIPGKNVNFKWSNLEDSLKLRNSELVLIPDKSIVMRILVTDTVSKCTVEDSVAVSIKPLPVLEIIQDTSFCFGDSIYLNKSRLFNCIYYWESDSIGFYSSDHNPKVSIYSSSLFYGKVKDTITLCSARDSAWIQVINLPQANAGKDTLICKGLPVTLGDTGQTNELYHWTSTIPGFHAFSSRITITPDSNSVFFLEVFDKNTLCANKDTIEVRHHPPVYLKSNYDSAYCFGDTIRMGEPDSTSFQLDLLYLSGQQVKVKLTKTSRK